MHPSLVLTRKSLMLFFKNKAGFSITFLVPIVMIYLFGHVFGLYRKETGPSGIPVAVVNQSGDPATDVLVDALKQEKAFHVIDVMHNADGTTRPLTEADVRAGLHNNDYRYALIIPADVISTEKFGIHLRFLSDPRNEIESQTVNGLLQKTIFMRVPRLLGRSLQTQAQRYLGENTLHEFNHSLAHLIAEKFGGDPEKIEQRIVEGDFFTDDLSASPSAVAPGDPKLRRLDPTPMPGAAPRTAASEDDAAANVLSRIFRFDTEQVAGQHTSNPMAARLVGGYAIMFLLFALSGSATSLFEEKRIGIFQRILSAPVKRSDILWGRFLFGILLGALQISALFLAGKIFYGLDIGSHLPALAVLTFAAAAACTAFGMLVAAVAPTPESANGLSTLIIMTMSAIGGAWFPITFMPDFIQNFSKLTIVYWAVEGFTAVLWAGAPLREILPHIGILAGIAVAVMLVAIACFKRNKMFD